MIRDIEMTPWKSIRLQGSFGGINNEPENLPLGDAFFISPHGKGGVIDSPMSI
jgi:hypothetical protein